MDIGGLWIWLSGYLVIWLSGYLVIWLSGYLVIWLSGYLVIWLSGHHNQIYDHAPSLHRSSPTAHTIIAPVTISCTQFGNPSCEHPMCITAIIPAPARLPTPL